jgi:hypothetical protein
VSSGITVVYTDAYDVEKRINFASAVRFFIENGTLYIYKNDGSTLGAFAHGKWDFVVYES